ncbi:MAG: hypothetical protein AAFP69_08860 [Planctomycetota bacterium]
MTATLVSSPDATKVNQSVADEKHGAKLLGRCTFDAFEEMPYRDWFQKNQVADFDPTITRRLAKRVDEEISITVFMGSWCGDSQRYVPRLFALSKQVGLPAKRINLQLLDYAVGSYKRGPTGAERDELIHRVPTIIVRRGEQELGRIVESPMSSLEMDITQILEGLPPTPRYRLVPLADAWLKAHPEVAGGVWNQTLADEFVEQYEHDSSGDSELATFARVLYDRGDYEPAIAIAKLNVAMYPDSLSAMKRLMQAYQASHESGSRDR